MRILITIIWFLVFTKLLVFWVWLWQLKEYHFKRFRAHFETQKLRKFLFSFHGIRYPKLTLKVVIILVSGIILEIIFIFFNSYILFLLSVLFAPLLVSILVWIFQIPRYFLIKRTLKRAGIKRERFKDLIVVGIAGSYGKSSAKEFLSLFLSERYKVLKTKKNINSEIGIANTILKELKPEHQVFVAEIGAYERGKIKQVCNIIKPQIGILTGINEQHMSTFGSQENISKAKHEIIENASKFAIQKNRLNLSPENIRVGKESLSFSIKGIEFRANLLGRQNIDNILLAASCAQKLGVDLNKIAKLCLNLKPEQGGLKILKRVPVILDASYSANPDGVIADLDYLNLYSGKKIIVMPCLIELGRAASEVHKRIGKKIAEVCDLGIITTADYFQELKNNKTVLIENPEKIAEKIRSFSAEVILLEGRVPKKLLELL